MRHDQLPDQTMEHVEGLDKNIKSIEEEKVLRQAMAPFNRKATNGIKLKVTQRWAVHEPRKVAISLDEIHSQPSPFSFLLQDDVNKRRISPCTGPYTSSSLGRLPRMFKNTSSST